MKDYIQDDKIPRKSMIAWFEKILCANKKIFKCIHFRDTVADDLKEYQQKKRGENTYDEHLKILKATP